MIPLSCPGGISDHCLAIGWGNRSPKRRYLKYFMRKLGCRFNHSPNITLNHSSFQCINKRQRNVIMKSESECRLGSRKCTLHLYIFVFLSWLCNMLTLLNPRPGREGVMPPPPKVFLRYTLNYEADRAEILHTLWGILCATFGKKIWTGSCQVTEL